RSSGPKSRTTPPARMGRMVMHVMVAHEHDVSAYFDPSAAVKRAPVTPVLSSFILPGRRRPGAPAQSIVTSRCWRHSSNTVAGEPPVPDRMAGIPHIDP